MAEPLDNPAASSESSEDEQYQPQHGQGERYSPMHEGEEGAVTSELPGDSGTQSQSTDEETTEAAAAPQQAHGQPPSQAAGGPSKKKPAKKTRTPSSESSAAKDEAGTSAPEKSSGKKRTRRGKTKSEQEKSEQTEPKSEPDPAEQSLGNVWIEFETAVKEIEESPQHRASKKARADEPGQTSAGEEDSSDQPSLLIQTGKPSIAPGHAAGEEGHASYASAALEQEPLAEHSQHQTDGGSSAQTVTTPPVERHELQSEKVTEGDVYTSKALQHGSEEPTTPEAEGPSKEGGQPAADTPQKLRRHSKGASSKILSTPPTPTTPEKSGGIKRERHGKKKPSSHEGTQELPITRPSEQKLESAPTEQTPQVVTKEAEAAVEEPESPQHSAVKKARASQYGKTSDAQQESQRGVMESTAFEQMPSSSTAGTGEAKRYEQKGQKASTPKRHPAASPRKSGKVKKQPLGTAKPAIGTSQASVVTPGSQITIPEDPGEAAVTSELPGDVQSQRRAAIPGDLEQSERSLQKEATASLKTVQLPELRTSQQIGAKGTGPQEDGKTRGADVPTLTSDKPLDEVEGKASLSEAEQQAPLSEEPAIEVGAGSSSAAATQEPQRAVVVPEGSGGSERVTSDAPQDPQTSSGISSTRGPPRSSDPPSPEENWDILHALFELRRRNVISHHDFARGSSLYHMGSFDSYNYDLVLGVVADRRLLRRQVEDACAFYEEMNRGPRRQQEARSATPYGYASRSGRELGGAMSSSRRRESASYSSQRSAHLSERGGPVATRRASREPRASSSRESSSPRKGSDSSHRLRAEDTARPRDPHRSSGREDGSGRSSSNSHERAGSRRESSSSHEERSPSRGRSGERRRFVSEPSSSARRSPSRIHGRETGSSSARHSRDTQRQSQRREPSPSRRTSAGQSRHQHTAPHRDESRTRSRDDTRSSHRAPSDSSRRSEVSHRDARQSRHETRHHSSHDVRDAPRVERSRDNSKTRPPPSGTVPRGPHTPTTTPPTTPPPSTRRHRHRHRTGTSSRHVQSSDSSALTTAHQGDRLEHTGSAPASSLGEQAPGASGGAASFPFQSSQSSPPGGWPLPGGNGPPSDYPFKVPRPPKPQRRASAPPTPSPRLPLQPADSGPQNAGTESTEPGVFVLSVPVELSEDLASRLPWPLESYTPYERVFIDKIDLVAVYTMRMRQQAEIAESRAVVESARRYLAEPIERDPDDSDSDHDAETGHAGTPEEIEAGAFQTQSPQEPITHHDQEVPEGMSQSESLSQTPLGSLAPSAPDSSASGMSDEFLSFSMPESTAVSTEMTPSQVPGVAVSLLPSEVVGGADASSTHIITLQIEEPSLLAAGDSSISKSAEEISGKPSKRPKQPPQALATDLSGASVETAASADPTAGPPAAAEAPPEASQDEQSTDRGVSSPLRTGVPTSGPATVMQEPTPDVFPAMTGSVPPEDPMVPDIDATESLEGVELAPTPPSGGGAGQLAPSRPTSTSPSTMDQESPSASQHDVSFDLEMSSPQGSDITMSPPCASPRVDVPPPTDQQLLPPAHVPAGIAVEEAAEAMPAPTAPSAGHLEGPVRELGASPTSMEEESTATRPELSPDEEMATSPIPGAEPEPSM